MAALDNPHNVKSSISVDVKSSNQTVIVWDLELESSSDTLIVPGLYTTYNVLTAAAVTDGLAGSLTLNITASGAAKSGGLSTVTITGGVQGQRVLIATSHQKGLSNNLIVDEDPT